MSNAMTKEILYIKQPEGKGPGAIKVANDDGSALWIDCWPDTLNNFEKGATFTFGTYEGKEFNGKRPLVVSKKDAITRVGAAPSQNNAPNTVTVANVDNPTARRIIICGVINRAISAGCDEAGATAWAQWAAKRADRIIAWSETGDLSHLGVKTAIPEPAPEPEPIADLDDEIPF